MVGGRAASLLPGSRRRRLSSADSVLAALVLGIVSLLVVPLPTWLLDGLLAANLAGSVVVLLIVLNVTDALKIAAFPTLLLLTTLFRLALNVSSTRLILLQANAGEVIQAFGQFVVRGNYVVGGVIFLILTAIQFIVIAKGSERVAEVGARFTLDAMPGKQMAIDAELRSGAIDSAEARRRRHALARESQFYGSMDGAMKFVKGDTIASLLITLINLLGGLAIGVGQREMDAVEALKRYGLLSIGDGLVSQIPALVLATAAGILVTRVASEAPDTALGQELGGQLFAAPRALRSGAYFVLLLALVPGLPALPFLVIAGLLFAASRARPSEPEASAHLAGGPRAPQAPGEAAAPRFLPMVVPWSLELGPGLSELLDDDYRGEVLKRPGVASAIAALRELTFRELGVPLPACQLQVEPELPPRGLVLSLQEVPTLVLEVPEELPDQELAGWLIEHLLPTLRQRAVDFLGIAETQALLDRLEQVAPATVRQVVPKPISVLTLSDVLRRLVEEELSVRDLKGILEALALVGNTEKDPLNLAEFTRAQLRRSLSFELTRGASELDVLLLEPTIEETLRAAIARTPAGSYLTLSPAAGRDVVRAIQRAARSAGPGVVLLTQPDIRRFVRKLIATELPALKVVSYAELLPELSLRPVGEAKLGAA